MTVDGGTGTEAVFAVTSGGVRSAALSASQGAYLKTRESSERATKRSTHAKIRNGGGSCRSHDGVCGREFSVSSLMERPEHGSVWTIQNDAVHQPGRKYHLLPRADPQLEW